MSAVRKRDGLICSGPGGYGLSSMQGTILPIVSMGYSLGMYLTPFINYPGGRGSAEGGIDGIG